MTSTRFALRSASAGVALATVVALSGCSAVLPMFGIQATPPAPASAGSAAVGAPAADTALEFASVFTDMGSIHPVVDLADQLQLRLDVWTEQKTHEWTPDADKRFSFVIGVYDNRVPADAPFDQKRRVYMSNITVSAATTAASGVAQTPYLLNTDPLKVALDPEALRSEQGLGLLITSPKGGFQLESQRIGALSADTEGLMLDFATRISYETAPRSNAYTTQLVHQYVPVAIFGTASAPAPTSTPAPQG